MRVIYRVIQFSIFTNLVTDWINWTLRDLPNLPIAHRRYKLSLSLLLQRSPSMVQKIFLILMINSLNDQNSGLNPTPSFTPWKNPKIAILFIFFYL
jgi:hypothetical protein